MAYQEGIRFCHITPTPFLEKFVPKYNTQLVLAHLIEEDERYATFYRKYNGVKIMDNSAFEMYKQGKPMYAPNRLIAMVKKLILTIL